MYWRLLTPLVILWGSIYQRLNSGCSCDAVVSHTGACDRLDPEDKNDLPLSMRLSSENTSAYVQGRNRLPLEILKQGLTIVWST